MYNDVIIKQLVDYINNNIGIGKEKLKNKVAQEFHLTLDRSVYFCADFAIRFSSSTSRSFANCVLSLSNLRKFDDRPFIVCVVLPNENYMLLANSTCLKRITHSSQELRVNNIRGTFLGSDILRVVDGTENSPENFKNLYLFHEQYGFEGNLERLVETTNNIVGTKTRKILSENDIASILAAPTRAMNFIKSDSFQLLQDNLKERVDKVQNEICIAAFIENVNIRGRIIEYLITSDSTDSVKNTLIDALNNNGVLPKIMTHDKLGDYSMTFKDFLTETDIKTKVLFLDANPKAYNIDKLLDFLSKDNSVYLIFFVGIDEHKNISTRLCSMFQQELLENTKCMKHWAGRGTRGVTQFYGYIIKDLLLNNDNKIDSGYSLQRLKEMIDL
jgi:hypothetical protein